ncbi:transcription repressor OFP3-like [Phalaenopsis equestris]|uniref:transcription repressor OFP3-like n=1 Tax=Phalaenopsis equestris TaxID=78828 RepID=UPI0009E2F8FC|nr:transcription repressor OFP3-like [Phalaenopsis equestris]
MKWGKKTRAEDEKKTRKSSFSSTSSSSSSFHLSNFFPFSWYSLLKRQKHDRTNPKQSPPTSSAHLCFTTQLLHPPAGEAPRRRSTGEEDHRRDKTDISRSSRHYSFSEFDLELRPISSFRQCDDSPPPPTPMKRAADRRRRQRIRPKVKVCSPKVARRMLEEQERKERRNLESFAVVKSSSDPQRDFRDSMVEMIIEKGMTRPEEMERLLACYISLNADEHHDAIIGAFRQVCFEFDARRFAGECHCCHCCDCF